MQRMTVQFCTIPAETASEQGPLIALKLTFAPAVGKANFASDPAFLR